MAKRTMATKKINKKKGPFLFGNVNANFSSGRLKPPSNNIGQQSMFNSPNPYAQSRVMSALQQRQQQLNAPPTMPGSAMDIYNTQGYEPAMTAMQQPGSPVMGALSNYGQGPDYSIGNVARSMYGAPNGAPNTATAHQQAIQAGTQTPQGRAAQLLLPALKGNPFITPEGRSRLEAGQLPDMNMIQPAFWQYTSPVIQQALTGLYQSGAVRPEEQQFTQQQWTPMGLAR